jgi:hypothetical protein
VIAVTGASGFVGRATCAALRKAGYRVITVGRAGAADVRWDPFGHGFDQGERAKLVGAHAAVHLAGATIGVRWTEARKREILESRVLGTTLIARALAALEPRPAVLVCASAIGYYGDRGDEWLDESSAPGADFLAGVTAAWERAADPAREAGIRVVHLRQGIVLGAGGGALARMLPAFRLGLGGALGGGRQWMSWIALADLVSVIRFALDATTLEGPVNATAPTPVRNAEFTTTLARVLSRPAVFDVPAFALRLAFGEMADVALLASQRVRAARLADAGFRFELPLLEDALRASLRT